MNFPKIISLSSYPTLSKDSIFLMLWDKYLQEGCRDHLVWQSDFVKTLSNPNSDAVQVFQLAATWSINMVVGSYCFPRYVAALASRAEQDSVRHGLLENAWDESGSHGHTSRS